MTFTVSGVSLPYEARSVLRAARDMGLAAIFSNPYPIAGQCPNCSDMSSIIVTLYNPKKTDANKKGRYIDGAFRETDNKYFDCPLCVDRESKITHLIMASGLNLSEAGYRLSFFETLPDDQRKKRQGALDAANEILADAPNPVGWLSIYGSFGTGKSGVLKSLVSQLCATGCRAHYVTATTLKDEYMEAFDDDSKTSHESASAITRRYLSYQFLAVDEIDKPNLTKWTKERLFALFDERYRRIGNDNQRGDRFTAIATNCNPGGLPEELRYLESRMRDGKRVVMGGSDLRGGKYAK